MKTTPPQLYPMKDGYFSFWAVTDSRTVVVFRVRKDVGIDHQAALTRARQKKILGSGIFPRGCTICPRIATIEEIEAWAVIHPNYPFLGVATS